MKNFSLPRVAIILWFINYAFLSLVSYVIGNGRHLISDFIIYSTILLALELVCLGLIEDVSPQS